MLSPVRSSQKAEACSLKPHLLSEDHAVIGRILEARVESIQLMAGAIHIVPVLSFKLNETSG